MREVLVYSGGAILLSVGSATELEAVVEITSTTVLELWHSGLFGPMAVIRNDKESRVVLFVFSAEDAVDRELELVADIMDHRLPAKVGMLTVEIPSEDLGEIIERIMEGEDRPDYGRPTVFH